MRRRVRNRTFAPLRGAIAAAGVAGVVLLTAFSAAPAVAQPQSGIVRPDYEPAHADVHLGAELFAANCSTCHGIAGSGIEHPRPGAGAIMGQGPSLRGVGAQAADFYLRTGYMPLGNPHEQPYKSRVLFTHKEIDSLIDYVASLGPGPGIPSPKPSTGNIAEGNELFTLNCAGCHQEDARGGFVTGARVPPLQGVTPTEIAEAVRIGPYLMPKFPTSEISNSQLNAIIRYLQLQDNPDNRGGWGIGNIGPIPEGLVVVLIAIPLLILSCLTVGRRMRKS